MESKMKYEDRLSSLSDTILVHILSFLPTLDAVRTMLIEPFGPLWTSLPNLDLDDGAFDLWSSHNPDDDAGDGDDDDDEGSSLNWAFLIYARNMLIRHKSSKLTEFRVNIDRVYYQDVEKYNLGDELNSWIDFAIRKHVHKLEFNVGMFELDEPLHKLTYSEFVSDSLVELKLELLEIKLLKRVQMRSLRVLRLRRVDISGDVFKEIIRGCSSLQELEINNCFTLGELMFDVPNVEKLVLDTTEYEGQFVQINCPKLRYFHYTGILECVDCVEIQNLASVVEVNFDLESLNIEWEEYQGFLAALKQILSAKIVSFSSESVTVLFYCMFKDVPHTLMDWKWKQVKLSILMTQKHVTGLCRLLTNSPFLEELQLKVTYFESDYVVPIESAPDCDSLDEEQICWPALKRISIQNVSMCSYLVLIRLVEVLLKNASALEDLVICYYYKRGELSAWKRELMPEEWAEFSEKLPTFQKTSQHVKILLQESVSACCI